MFMPWTNGKNNDKNAMRLHVLSQRMPGFPVSSSARSATICLYASPRAKPRTTVKSPRSVEMTVVSDSCRMRTHLPDESFSAFFGFDRSYVRQAPGPGLTHGATNGSMACTARKSPTLLAQVLRVLVVGQRRESRMPEVIVRRPLLNSISATNSGRIHRYRPIDLARSQTDSRFEQTIQV